MRTWRIVLLAALAVVSAAGVACAEDPPAPLRAGIIGLDAHGLPWTQILNNPAAEGPLADMRVVAAWPGGSPDIPQSQEILARSVEPVRALGVEIVDSIEALLQRADVVLLLSIDGRKHLEQARPVIAAGKPLFVDKPMAASAVEAGEIFRLAAAAGVPCFSSSALRFAPGTQAVLSDPAVGPILGCDAFSPAALEPHHPDLFWYGIHGVETLFTVMGPGCVSVSRTYTEGADMVVGRWRDGRLGSFRGGRGGPHTYGATVFGTKSNVAAGRFEGYEPLLVEIVKFFQTGQPPVAAETTLEILAFMEAAQASREQDGGPVDVPSLLEAARRGLPRSVLLRVDQQAGMTLDGQPVTLLQLAECLAQLKAGEDREILIRLQAHRLVRTGQIQEIIRACQSAGVDQFGLEVDPEE